MRIYVIDYVPFPLLLTQSFLYVTEFKQRIKQEIDLSADQRLQVESTCSGSVSLPFPCLHFKTESLAPNHLPWKDFTEGHMHSPMSHVFWIAASTRAQLNLQAK